MSPVLVLLVLSPLLLSLLIVGLIVCIAILRVAPTDIQGVLRLLIKLFMCLGAHFPGIGARRLTRRDGALDARNDVADAVDAAAEQDAEEDDGAGNQDEEAVV